MAPKIIISSTYHHSNHKTKKADKMKTFKYLMHLTVTILLAFASPIYASSGSIFVITEPPTADNNIQIGAYNQIGALACFSDIPKENPNNLTHHVEINGQTVHFFLFGELLPQFGIQPSYCYQTQTGKPDVIYNLGKLPAGNYNLQVYIRQYTEALPITLSPSVRPFEQLNFTVIKAATPSSTSQVPTLSNLGLVTLLLGMILAASLFKQRRT